MSQDPTNPKPEPGMAGPNPTHLRPIERATQLIQRAETTMENSRALIVERRARHEAELLAERMARLQSITASLAKALTTVEVAEVVVEQAISSLGASAGSLTVMNDTEDMLDVICAVGYRSEVIQTWQAIELDAPIPLCDAIGTGAAIWLESMEEIERRYPALLADMAGREHGSLASLPLMIEGRAIGAIGLSFRNERQFTVEERKFAMTIAHQCAQALERARLYRKMELANRAKDRFLAMLSHELRTPLTPVLGVIQAIEESDLPDDVRMLLGVARRNVELEARLIDDLLDITRVIQGKLSLVPEPVDIHSLIESVVAMCREEITAKKLALRTELHARRHHVNADSARLQQVLWNLVKNAIKFTPEGGEITIRSSNEDGEVCVEVNDTGIGIEPEMQRIIFDPFEQGGSQVTRRFGGLGLGLAISKAIVDLHEGALAVHSDGHGRGATFTLRCRAVRRPSSHPDPAADRSPMPPAAGGTILLVDDHEDTVTVMRKFLEREGYMVLSATTVNEALALAQEERFDLLVSDIGLPDGTGIDLIGKLRELGDVKGIALSGFGMEGDIERSIAAGFSEHLVKPVMLRRLQEAIRNLMA